MVFESRMGRSIQIILLMMMSLWCTRSHAQDLEFVDLGIVEGEFKRYDRTLTWINEGSDSLRIKLWSSDENLSFTPFKRSIAAGEKVEIPISIALPKTAGDVEYELRLLDQNQLVLHGFQMSFKVLRGELDVFKAYRNVHFPFRAKEEVFNLRSGIRGDTLTAFFDVYNLGGKAFDLSKVSTDSAYAISFLTERVPHHSFSTMRIDYYTNENSDVGFQRKILKMYEDDQLVAALPVQFTVLPQSKNEELKAKLNASIINHDFKVIREGANKAVKIRLANNGSAPLVIEKIESNCACLLYDQIDSIDVGEAIDFNVKFDATGRIGLERKTIAIFSNDPARPVLVLTFRAHVK